MSQRFAPGQPGQSPVPGQPRYPPPPPQAAGMRPYAAGTGFPPVSMVWMGKLPINQDNIM